MSNNRDFAMRREWSRYIEEWSEDDLSWEDYPQTDKEPVVNVKELNDLINERDDISFTAEGGFSGDLASLENTWANFRKRRPVTAHMLEELFGERAVYYFYKVSKEFTEKQAVRMVSYVYNNPRKILKKKEINRLEHLAKHSFTEE